MTHKIIVELDDKNEQILRKWAKWEDMSLSAKASCIMADALEAIGWSVSEDIWITKFLEKQRKEQVYALYVASEGRAE